MKARLSSVKWIVLSLACLAAGAAAQPRAALADATHADAWEGTETGHGGEGDHWYNRPIIHLPPSRWCSEFGSMAQEAFEDARDAETLAAKRASLAASIRYIMSSYDRGALPYQPLTYALLKTALKLDEQFPTRHPHGDQSGGLVLVNMLKMAQKVNIDFDTPYFVPWFESGDPADILGEQFYEKYLGAAHATLGMLFEPATPRAPGNLLDAMSFDRWQLQASILLLDYLSSSLRLSVFHRSFECLESRLSRVARKLAHYLKTTPVSSQRDRTKRIRVERQLRDALAELDGVHYRNGDWYCEYVSPGY